MSNIPIIDIKHGWLLEEYLEVYRKHTDQELEKSGFVTLSPEETYAKIELFEKQWDDEGKMIMQEILQLLELEFYVNKLRVCTVGGIRGGKSNPLIVSANYRPQDFVRILCHELIHVLFGDTETQDVTTILNAIMPDENRGTQEHAMIWAIEKIVYTTIKKETFLEKEMQVAQKHPYYERSFEIFSERGAENLVTEFKSHYV